MSELAYKKHLHILTQEEITELYARPVFNAGERHIYFELGQQERLAMEGMRGLSSKVFFILQLGYFKAKGLFFLFELASAKEEVAFILKTYFSGRENQELNMPARSTRLIQQNLIRQLTGYRDCKGSAKKAFLAKVLQLAGIHSDPVFIFRSLLHYLEVYKIILPSYSFMQRHIISRAIQLEQARLEDLLTKLLSQENKKLLDQLLERHEVGKVDFYLLTFLQQEPSDFNYQQMKRQLERKIWIESLYELAIKILPKLSISNENIKYHGSLAEHYSIYKLSRIQGGIRYLYLLCYGFNRYHYLNDTLIEAIRYHVRDYEEEADQEVDAQIAAYKLEAHESLAQVPTLLRLFIDPSIENETPFSWVRDKAFQFLSAEKLEFVAAFIEEEKLDKKQIKWAFITSLGRRIGLNLRPLVLLLNFESNTSSEPLLTALSFVKDVFGKGKKLAQIKIDKLPMAFIPDSINPYLWKEKEKLCLNRYEFFLYQKLRNKIESGDVFIPESYRYKSFDQDLINKTHWNKNQDHIINQLDLPKLKRPIEDMLTDWEHRIEKKYKEVNDKLQQGKLTNVKITGKHSDGSLKWHLHVPSAGETINHNLYQQFPSIGIIPLLHLVEEHTHFLGAFEHILKKNTFLKGQKDRILACILAYGTNYGIGKIANISDLNYPDLATTAHNYLRLETLQEANKKIVDQTMKLPMFDYYKIQDNIHSSSDGQKYGTQFHTINSRYSPKYFGLSKGIAAYTLVANNLPVNAGIMGANEHESHYVFDLLYNNISGIDPSIHSTDQHGINKVNFAILDMFGYQFAPRYANINSKSKLIHSFQHPTKYENYALKPVRKIDKELIKDEWNNNKRIFASLALKSTTQSTIIRKLSAYPRNNRTRRALVEYDAIIQTDFVLRYLDSPPLQHSIENVLNRGENINRLRKHIFHANGGRFRVHSVGEQQIWSECTRLIANAMIYYNTLLLSELLKEKQNQKDFQAVEKIKKISPIAWQHIHLHGRYQFLIDRVNINILDMMLNIDL